MKKIFKEIAIVISNIFEYPIKIIIRIYRSLMKTNCKFTELGIVTVATKPLFEELNKSNDFTYKIEMNKKLNAQIEYKLKNKTAIVLQGPISQDKDFTFETAKAYKEIYNNCDIIVSTWNGISKNIIKKFEDAGIILVENTPPNIKGRLNVNMQITSTLGGIKRAKELGNKMILKTRTDQRFDNPYFLFLLEIASEKLGEDKIITDEYQEEIPFFIKDYYMYGEINRMFELFSIQDDTLEIKREKINDIYGELMKVFKFDVWNKYMPPECYIWFDYFKKKNKDEINSNNIFGLYTDFLKNNIIILDEKILKMYWNKYKDLNFVVHKEGERTFKDTYDYLYLINNK